LAAAATKPLHAGFVGSGMLDAACPGNIFTSPTPDQVLAAAEAIDCGGGVLFIVKKLRGRSHEFLAWGPKCTPKEWRDTHHRR